MRMQLVGLLLVGCAPDEPEDDVREPNGPVPLSPIQGLEDLLDGVDRTEVRPDIRDGTLACDGTEWLAEVRVGGTATEVRATTWDVASGAFAGVFDLVEQGDRWILRASAADVGAPCTDPGGLNLVFVPIDDGVGGAASGLGTAGVEAVCGYTAFPSPNLFFQPLGANVDEAGWRTAEIYRGAAAEGAMAPEGTNAWSSEIPDPGWNSSNDMPPVMGIWGANGGAPVGTCVI